MIAIGEDFVEAVWDEMDALLHDYFARTIAKDGLPKLDMNWPAYIMLNNDRHLLLFTARDAGSSLLGFVMYHIVPHLHHIGIVNAACDIMAVGVDYRGRGIAHRMMEHAEPVLRTAGVHFITHQFRTCYDTEPLFPSLGYRLIEKGYLKELN